MPRIRLTMSDANKTRLFSFVLRFLLTKKTYKLQNVQPYRKLPDLQSSVTSKSSGNLPDLTTVKCKNVVVACEEIGAVEKETVGRVARSALPA